MPGTTQESVHATTWAAGEFTRAEAEVRFWEQLFLAREAVLPALEAARREKRIGKALEARVTLSDAPIERTDSNSEMLRELLNVSQLDLSSSGKESASLEVSVAHADGQKCERCWHWETDVGSNPEHPTLCGRCVDAIRQFKGWDENDEGRMSNDERNPKPEE